MKTVNPAEAARGAVAVRTPIDQWDTQIAPVLRVIEGHANHVARSATAIASIMMILALKPEWETRAAASLDDATQTVRNALDKLESARAAYADKPIMVG